MPEEPTIGDRVSAPVPARAEGQLAIDRQKDRIANRAADYGWSVTERDPALVLTKGERTISIEFNNAGMPKSAAWGGGEEFSSMDSSGVFYLAMLENWFDWKPADD